MKKIRLIARLDVKNNWLVKGIQMEGLRKLGHPRKELRVCYEAGPCGFVLARRLKQWGIACDVGDPAQGLPD